MSQAQAFLATFQQQYLKPLNHPLLSRARLVAQVDQKCYQRLVGKKHRLKNLPDQQSIWGLVNGETGQLVSIIHLTSIHDCMLGATPGPHQILQWSYTFTDPSPKYRRQGLSSALRLASMLWGASQGVEYINSVPFPGSESNPLLQSFGFTRYYDRPFDLDYYIKDITDQTALAHYVQGRLARYRPLVDKA